MKKIIYKSLLFTLPIFTLFSCDTTEEVDLARKGKPVLEVSNTTIDVVEGYGKITFNFSYPIKDESQVRVEVIGGTATDGDDYLFGLDTVEDYSGGYFAGDGYLLEVPAQSTSFDFFFATNDDGITEGVETIELRLHSVSQGQVLIYQDVTVRIHDASELSFQLDWPGTSGSVNFCDADMDLELYDADFNILLDSYYGNCEENITIPSSGAPPGTYYLVVSLWDNAGYTQNVNIPAILTTSRVGDPSSAVTTDLSSYFNLGAGGFDNGNNDALVILELVLNDNGFWTLNNDQTNIFYGRSSNFVSNRLRK